jgi:hypothetical protein
MLQGEECGLDVVPRVSVLACGVALTSAAPPARFVSGVTDF